jgi:hypothetical protein
MGRSLFVLSSVLVVCTLLCSSVVVSALNADDTESRAEMKTASMTQAETANMLAQAQTQSIKDTAAVVAATNAAEQTSIELLKGPSKKKHLGHKKHTPPSLKNKASNLQKKLEKLTRPIKVKLSKAAKKVKKVSISSIKAHVNYKGGVREALRDSKTYDGGFKRHVKRSNKNLSKNDRKEKRYKRHNKITDIVRATHKLSHRFGAYVRRPHLLIAAKKAQRNPSSHNLKKLKQHFSKAVLRANARLNQFDSYVAKVSTLRNKVKSARRIFADKRRSADRSVAQYASSRAGHVGNKYATFVSKRRNMRRKYRAFIKARAAYMKAKKYQAGMPSSVSKIEEMKAKTNVHDAGKQMITTHEAMKSYRGTYESARRHYQDAVSRAVPEISAKSNIENQNLRAYRRDVNQAESKLAHAVRTRNIARRRIRGSIKSAKTDTALAEKLIK